MVTPNLVQVAGRHLLLSTSSRHRSTPEIGPLEAVLLGTLAVVGILGALERCSFLGQLGREPAWYVVAIDRPAFSSDDARRDLLGAALGQSQPFGGAIPWNRASSSVDELARPMATLVHAAVE
ncbi:MAG: hypothetical protein QM655_02340 [Nocardioidaceae bacterium]